MKYKVGDKVIALKVGDVSSASDLHNLIGEIGVVYAVHGMIDSYQYDIQFSSALAPWNDNNTCGFLEEELEPVVEIGQQLLFSFMEEE